MSVCVFVNSSYLHKWDCLQYLPAHHFTSYIIADGSLSALRARCKQGLGCSLKCSLAINVHSYIFAPLLQGPVGPLQAAVPCKPAWELTLGVGDVYILGTGITLGVGV